MTSSPRHPVFKVDDKVEQELVALGQLLCTPEEVAVALGRSEAATTPALAGRGRAAKAFNKGRAEGVKALRRAQLKLAETSVTMAIFLGKTELGQGERRELDLGDAIDLSEAGRRAEERLAALIAVAPEAGVGEAEG